MEDDEIFVPVGIDRDEDAESAMYMGKVESMRDPWFEDDYAASHWEPQAKGQ